MSSNLVIRNVISSDLPQVLEIINLEILNGTANLDEHPISISHLENQLEEKASLGFPYFVADIDRKIVGFATFGSFRTKAGFAKTVEHSIYLHPAFQGKGVGQKLMTQLISEAKEKGFLQMIGAITADNLSSILFHQKFGFKEVGRLVDVARKFDRPLDLVFVQLTLT